MQMNEICLYIILVLVWAYVLYVLKKQKLTAFYFMLGSAGFFGFTFIAFKTYLTKVCSVVLLFLMNILGKATNYYSVYEYYNIIFINNKDSAISMYIDYECCGVIEILVLISLVLFFPVFTLGKKILNCIIGSVYIMVANVVRLFCVSTFIYYKGNDYYYIAHAVIGRIIFYILTILLYFYMLSWTQIKKQKIGNFTYDS